MALGIAHNSIATATVYLTSRSLTDVSVIAPLLPASNVVLDLAAQDKDAVFQHVANLLEEQVGVRKGSILDSLRSRERLGSTGLGHGIAIPHGRVRGMREAVGVLVRTRTPIAFDAPDGQPVDLMFVLLVPEKSTDLHLEILGTLAQMFSDRELRAALLASADAVSAQRLIAGWGARPTR